MGAETLVDFCANPAAIHVHHEIAIAVNLHRSLRVFVGQPSEPPRGPDRGVWRSNLDVFAFRKQPLTSLPHRLESIDQPKNRTVALHLGARFPADCLVQCRARRLRLGKPRF
jgi:hypothetical protein